MPANGITATKICRLAADLLADYNFDSPAAIAAAAATEADSHGDRTPAERRIIKGTYALVLIVLEGWKGHGWASPSERQVAGTIEALAASFIDPAAGRPARRRGASYARPRAGGGRSRRSRA